MDGNFTIGILALQGAFSKHQQALESLEVSTLQVRTAQDLARCHGLILPGGESTSMTTQILDRDLLEPLRTFASHSPIFGTCAGMILMAKEGLLSLLDISVERNAYGRQKASFLAELSSSPFEEPLLGYFIRAPRIRVIYSSELTILSQLGNEAVWVRQGFHLATSFHPELTNDRKIHRYFIQLCKQKQSLRPPSKITSTKSFQMI